MLIKHITDVPYGCLYHSRLDWNVPSLSRGMPAVSKLEGGKFPGGKCPTLGVTVSVSDEKSFKITTGVFCGENDISFTVCVPLWSDIPPQYICPHETTISDDSGDMSSGLG